MRIIDLSTSIVPSPPEAPPLIRVEIAYASHADGAAQIERMFKVPAKHKYVWFEGRNKKRLAKECRYPFKPYPKWQSDLDLGVRSLDELASLRTAAPPVNE